MTKKTKKVAKILLIVWLTFLIIDFTLAQVQKPPVFAIPIIRYKDGGSTEYFGLGYKVIKYVNLSAERGPELVDVDFGSWMMKFSPPL